LAVVGLALVALVAGRRLVTASGRTTSWRGAGRAVLGGYDRPLALGALAVSLITFGIDIYLLERKYEISRSGFLQDHPLTGLPTFLIFLAVLLLSEILFFFAIAGAWGAASRWLGVRPVLGAYHYVSVVGGLSIAITAARYQILSYFADFVDFTVLRNLGGGSLSAAVAYGFEEGRLFAGVTGSALVAYVVGHFVVRRAQGMPARSETRVEAVTVRWSLTTTVVSVIGLALLVLAVNRHEDYRHHLSQVSAYSYARQVLDRLTDVDGDGYGLFAWSADPAPFDPTVYPNALDVPGDGVDQNGLAGDFIYQPSPRMAAVFPGRKQHLIVIVLESARADVLQAHVGDRPVTPELRKLAAAGAAGSAYYSHTGFSTSSLKAIFSASLSARPAFGSSLFTLLKDHGYQVAVVSGQDETFGDIAGDLQMRSAAASYFDASMAVNDRVFPSMAPNGLAVSNERVVRQFAAAAQDLDWSRPVFAYINLQSAHFPYYHPGMPVRLDAVSPLARSAIRIGRQREVYHTYLNAIADADAAVGRLLTEIARHGSLDDMLVVVTGDHGESLFDDGLLGHGHQLNDVQTRTLLVASRPLPELRGLLGQIDLAGVLLRGIGARLVHADTGAPLDQAPPRHVFQYIGRLERPLAIGLVDQDGERVVFNVGARRVHFSASGTWIGVEALGQHPREQAKFTRLVTAWEHVHWEQHLFRAGQR
jgi:phosphoglycerol transferase MdoB-like AlkP superfamily enzyme